MSFVVITKVQYPDEIEESLLEVGKAMIPIAQQQPGFIAVTYNLSNEGNETMMYWEWQTEADHEACMNSPDWLKIVEQSAQIFQTEGVEFSMESYERIA